MKRTLPGHGPTHPANYVSPFRFSAFQTIPPHAPLRLSETLNPVRRRRRSPSRDRYRSRSRDRDYRRRSRSRDRGGYGGDRGGYGRRSPPPPRYGGGFDSRGRSPPRGMGRRATPPATGLHMFVAGLNFICTEKVGRLLRRAAIEGRYARAAATVCALQAADGGQKPTQPCRQHHGHQKYSCPACKPSDSRRSSLPSCFGKGCKK